MDIIILANFCGSLSSAENNRFLYLANILSENHNVELVTSDFHHGTKTHRSAPSESSYKITLLHEPGYPKNICLQRFASHREFGKHTAAYLKKRKKPDVIYCAVPSLTAPLAAASYCRKNGVRFVIDIQDLWPEAFEMISHVPVVSTLAFSPFRSMANRVYRTADAICGVSRTYVERALSVNTKTPEGVCVFLGTELKTFDRNVQENAASGKSDGELWLGYCGTLGASYDLTCAFDALALLQMQGVTPPKFIVMGDGPRRAEFEAYARTKGVDVRFTGMLPYEKMCGLLRACDITVNPITARAAQSIINKHADYAASGCPVISTQECPEYQDLVETYYMGFNCANNDPEDLAAKLMRLLNDPALREEMGRNARRCAEERFDRAKTYRALVDTIIGLQEKG